MCSSEPAQTWCVSNEKRGTLGDGRVLAAFWHRPGVCGATTPVCCMLGLELPSRAHRSPRQQCQLTSHPPSAAIIKRTYFKHTSPISLCNPDLCKALPSSSRSGCSGWAHVSSCPCAPAVTPHKWVISSVPPKKGPFLTCRVAASEERRCLGCPCPISLLLSRVMGELLPALLSGLENVRCDTAAAAEGWADKEWARKRVWSEGRGCLQTLSSPQFGKVPRRELCNTGSTALPAPSCITRIPGVWCVSQLHGEHVGWVGGCLISPKAGRDQ